MEILVCLVNFALREIRIAKNSIVYVGDTKFTIVRNIAK